GEIRIAQAQRPRQTGHERLAPLILLQDDLVRYPEPPRYLVDDLAIDERGAQPPRHVLGDLAPTAGELPRHRDHGHELRLSARVLPMTSRSAPGSASRLPARP